MGKKLQKKINISERHMVAKEYQARLALENVLEACIN